MDEQLPRQPDPLQLKGRNAEEFLHNLASKTFFTDWCFLNPKLPDGKELCDLLVVFDDVAIIWQVKDLKLDEHGRYNPREVEKNIKQLGGAYRQLFELKTPIELENVRRTKTIVDPASIHEVYLVSALLGEGEDMGPMMGDVRNQPVHVFTRRFTEIVLNELDTVGDFVKYLKDKNNFFATKSGSLIILGGEEELLAYYLLSDRSFEELKGFQMVTLDGDHWQHLTSKPSYIAKKAADKISYAWDSIIDRAHEGSAEYERVARELARPNRFIRRGLGQSFYDAHVKAHEDKEHEIFRRVGFASDSLSGGEVTYCFLFMDEKIARSERIKMLEAMCFVARGKVLKNKKVIGIATEKVFAPECSYDFFVLELPEWNDDLQQHMERIQTETGIMTNAVREESYEQEYPDVPAPKQR